MVVVVVATCSSRSSLRRGERRSGPRHPHLAAGQQRKGRERRTAGKEEQRRVKSYPTRIGLCSVCWSRGKMTPEMGLEFAGTPGRIMLLLVRMVRRRKMRGCRECFVIGILICSFFFFFASYLSFGMRSNLVLDWGIYEDGKDGFEIEFLRISDHRCYCNELLEIVKFS